jgi:hypothetical protein
MIKIFALEGEWDSKKLEEKKGIEPMLRYMQDSLDSQYILRRVNTKESLSKYFKQLNERRYKNHQVVYMAFHGSSRKVWLDNEDSISFDELAELADGALKDRVVHFGSCQVMRTSVPLIEEFKEKTGARFVSGYSKTVDFLDGTLFDMVLLYYSTIYDKNKTILSRLEKDYDSLCNKLGFKMI